MLGFEPLVPAFLYTDDDHEAMRLRRNEPSSSSSSWSSKQLRCSIEVRACENVLRELPQDVAAWWLAFLSQEKSSKVAKAKSKIYSLSLISHKNILIKTHRDSLCERERQREWHTLTLCFVWNQEPAVLFSFDFIHENLDRFCLFKHSGGLPSCNLCLNKKLTIKRFVLRHVQI